MTTSKQGRAPRVRDAVLNHINAHPNHWQTCDQIAQAVGEDPASVGCALYTLSKRSAVVRRRKSGTGSPFEYDVGPRIDAALKYVGKKFPLRGGHRRIKGLETVTPNAAVPAASGGVGIVIKIDKVAHAITLTEARAIYDSFKVLFERR